MEDCAVVFAGVSCQEHFCGERVKCAGCGARVWRWYVHYAVTGMDV